MRDLIYLAYYMFFLALLIYLISPKYKKNEIGNNIVRMLASGRQHYSFWNPTGKSLIWSWKNAEEYALEWNKNKTKINNYFVKKEFEPNKKFSNKAVIHFRCSDVPFMKHPNYTLLPKDYFLFALKKIEKNNVDEIVFLNCSGWNSKFISNPEEKCNSYINTISDWLEENTKIKVNRQKICIGIKETYEIMLGCKILVSTGGSFSFIPGITKNKNFISPSNIGEGDEKIFQKFKNIHKLVHWTMWDKFDVINHEGIDYETFDYSKNKKELTIL